MHALDKARPVDVKIVERTDHLVYDGDIVEQTEDTMTLLTKYVDDLETGGRWTLIHLTLQT